MWPLGWSLLQRGPLEEIQSGPGPPLEDVILIFVGGEGPPWWQAEWECWRRKTQGGKILTPRKWQTAHLGVNVTHMGTGQEQWLRWAAWV